MKHRLARVREVIKRELSEIVTRELTFEAKLVTIHDVEISPDLKQSQIYISAIGTDAEKEAAVSKLKENRVMLQHLLSRRVILKYTPQLHFRLDTSIERGTRVMQILNEIVLPVEGEGEKGEEVEDG